MAAEQITVDFDDRALFNSALQEAPPDTQPPPSAEPPPAPSQAIPSETAPPSPAPSPGDPPRDELGRFTPRQEPPAAPPPAAPPEQESAVPSWRLREEREQREAYATRLAEREAQLNQAIAYIQRMQAASQPAPAAPDPLLNPAEFNQYQAQSLQQMQATIAHQLRTNQLESNLQLTRLERGAERFDEAYQAFMRSAEGDVAFARAIVNSPNPGAAMCEWYDRAKALDTYGADPEAYFNQRVNALLSDKAFLAKAIDAARSMATGAQPGQQTQGRYSYAPSNNVTVLPPSLTSMRSGSSPESGITNAAGEDLMSDQMLFQAALAPGQSRR
jgi:hypothetical protein